MNFQRVLKIVAIAVLAINSDPASVLASEITLQLPNKISVNADFRPGHKDNPAVFLLHGYMATYNLNIIQLIADELEANSYTVLAPTLSLNINNRRAGANCEAVHNHTMESDIQEIAWWVDWLKAQGYDKLILTGFSTGALQVAIYLSHYQSDAIKKVVLVSPAYLAGKPFPIDTEKNDIAVAQRMMTANEKQLNKFSLSFCKGNFLSPPDVFLSYKKWNELSLVGVVKKIKLPKYVLVGSNDKRFTQDLPEKLKTAQSDVITISGANHFFDSPYEFDFLEKLNSVLVTEE